MEIGRIRIARGLTVVNKKDHEGPTKTHQMRDVALDESGVGILRADMIDLSKRAVEHFSGVAHGTVKIPIELR